MTRFAWLMGAVLALNLTVADAMAMDPQKWSMLIVRPNLDAFDDQQTQAAFDRIKERTNGELDMKIAFIGSLPIKEAEWLRAVGNGEVIGS